MTNDAKRVDIMQIAGEIEAVLQAASAGDYTKRCKVSINESFAENPLTTVVPSINLLLDDLRAKEKKRQKAEMQLQRTIENLQQKVETIKKQAEAIKELSTPAIEIWEGILVMPIVGVVDTVRGQNIMDEMLSSISNKQAKYVILDITGVEIVDTAVANHLIKVVQAGRILGTLCLLTGVKPSVAQTLVSIGSDLRSIATLRDLKSGLAFCLSDIERNGTPAVRK